MERECLCARARAFAFAQMSCQIILLIPLRHGTYARSFARSTRACAPRRTLQSPMHAAAAATAVCRIIYRSKVPDPKNIKYYDELLSEIVRTVMVLLLCAFSVCVCLCLGVNLIFARVSRTAAARVCSSIMS